MMMIIFLDTRTRKNIGTNNSYQTHVCIVSLLKKDQGTNTQPALGFDLDLMTQIKELVCM